MSTINLLLDKLSTIVKSRIIKMDDICAGYDIKEQQPLSFFSLTRFQNDAVVYSFNPFILNKRKSIQEIATHLLGSLIFSTIFSVIIYLVCNSNEYYSELKLHISGLIPFAIIFLCNPFYSNKKKTFKNIAFGFLKMIFYIIVSTYMVYQIFSTSTFYSDLYIPLFYPIMLISFVYPLGYICQVLTNTNGRLYVNKHDGQVVFQNDSKFSNENLTLTNNEIDEYKVVEENGFYYVSAVVYDDKKILNIDNKFAVAKLTKQNNINNKISTYLLKGQADALKAELDRFFLRRNYYQSIKQLPIWK